MEQNPTPLVSVIMPAYNAQAYIEEAIRSVIHQTYTNWQLLIIDDASSDDTYQIAERLTQEDARISLIRNETNQGVAKTRNRGLELAQGDYVALLDSDDVWRPQKLEKQLALAQEKQADIVYCSYAIVSEEGEKSCGDFLVSPSTDLEQMLIKSVISCSTVLLSREITRRYRFDPAYYHEDYVYWLTLIRDGWKAVGETEILADYRLVEGSRASNKFRAAKYRWDIYRKYLKLPFGKSLVYLGKYAINGFKKYKSV